MASLFTHLAKQQADQPREGELFKEYFASDLFNTSHDEMDRELAGFFQEMFQIDVDGGDIDKVNFPNVRRSSGAH